MLEIADSWRYYLSSLILAVLLTGCECTGVDCTDFGGFVALDLSIDGVAMSAIDSSARPRLDLAYFCSPSDTAHRRPITQQIDPVHGRLFLSATCYYYELRILGVDTLRVTCDAAIIDVNDCCDVYAITGLAIDGVKHCSQDCSTLTVDL